MQSGILIGLTLVIVIAGLAIFAYGVSDIRSGILVKAICRLPQNRVSLPFSLPKGQKILLTFDDGPDPDTTPLVLDVLQRHHQRAIFFLIGEKVERHPEIVKEIVRRGHIVGNHTWSHSPWANFRGRDYLEQEIRKTDDAIEKACGIRPTLFRPPLGVTPHFLRSLMRKTGHTVVGWDVRSLDTRDVPRSQVLRRIERRMSEGSIILLHDRLRGAEWLSESILKLEVKQA